MKIMFEGTIYSTILEAKEKIDFNSLQFPIYRKSRYNNEWYRFDSVTKLISIRKNNIIGIGISPETHDDVFVKIYSFEEECSKDEFDKLLKYVIDMMAVA